MVALENVSENFFLEHIGHGEIYLSMNKDINLFSML